MDIQVFKVKLTNEKKNLRAFYVISFHVFSLSEFGYFDRVFLKVFHSINLSSIISNDKRWWKIIYCWKVFLLLKKKNWRKLFPNSLLQPPFIIFFKLQKKTNLKKREYSEEQKPTRLKNWFWNFVFFLISTKKKRLKKQIFFSWLPGRFLCVSIDRLKNACLMFVVRQTNKQTLVIRFSIIQKSVIILLLFFPIYFRFKRQKKQRTKKSNSIFHHKEFH